MMFQLQEVIEQYLAYICDLAGHASGGGWEYGHG